MDIGGAGKTVPDCYDVSAKSNVWARVRDPFYGVVVSFSEGAEQFQD